MKKWNPLFVRTVNHGWPGIPAHIPTKLTKSARDKMTQDEILEIIKEHPGIMQKDIKNYLSCCSSKVHEQVTGLRNKRMVRREPAKQTWKLYAEE